MKKFSVINQRFNFNHLQGFPAINEEIINKHNYSFHPMEVGDMSV